MVPSLYEKGYIVSYKQGDMGLYRTPIPIYPGNGDNYHIVSEQDTLLSLAEKYYHDQFLWYIIADVNPDIEDIFSLTINTTLFIPDIHSLSLIYG